MINGMKALITGAEGFIGSHLVKKLGVVGVMDLKRDRDCNKRGHYPPKDYPDVIFHLAADLNPTDDRDIEMNRTVQQYWKDSGAHLVYTSSAAVYEPNNLYAVQKLYGEVMFKGASILRLFNVYGEGGSGVVDNFRRSDELIVHGNGSQARDFIAVEDVVRALEYAADTKFVGTADIGTGKVYTIMDLAISLKKEIKILGDEDMGVDYSRAKYNSDFKWSPRGILSLKYFNEKTSVVDDSK